MNSAKIKYPIYEEAFVEDRGITDASQQVYGDNN